MFTHSIQYCVTAEVFVLEFLWNKNMIKKVAKKVWRIGSISWFIFPVQLNGGGGGKRLERRGISMVFGVSNYFLHHWPTACTERDIHPFAQGTLSQSLSIEKDRAVLYSDFVTILRMALMQYITKLVMPQSQKPRSSLSKYKVMYPVDASVQTVKVHKIVLRGICQNLQPYKVLVNK